MTISEALLKVGNNVISEARANLMKKNSKQYNHIATKELYNSMKAVVVDDELSFELTDYAKYVDQGRKKGKYAPVDAIKKWCKVKGIKQSLAYVINRKIFLKGIDPTNFFTDPYDKNMANLDDQLDIYVQDMIDEILE